MPVSVCVYLSAIISLEIHTQSLPIFCVYYLWPWLNPAVAVFQYVMYFRFLGDIILSHKPRQLSVDLVINVI